MEQMHRAAPLARDEGLVVQELSDELLIYDLERHRAHSLNPVAALVWRHCDGRTGVTEIAATLQRELDLPPDEEIIWLALERLGKAHLLQERPVPPAAVARSSRRALVRRLAMVGGLGLISSIVAPTAQAAGSLGMECTPGTCTAPLKCCFPKHGGTVGFCVANCGGTGCPPNSNTCT